MIDASCLAVGVCVWTRGKNEYGDGATGGIVVDFGIDPDKGEYVIVLDGSPSYPKTSPKSRRWLYSRGDKGGIQNHGQLVDLRRLYVSDLAPCDGFVDRARLHEFAAKALIAAGIRRGEWDAGHAELDAAAHALLRVAGEMQPDDDEEDD